MLIEELKKLWIIDMHTYDSFTDEFFQLDVSLLWIKNDFPTFGDLSRWRTKGYETCPICMKDKSSFKIRGKISFMGHLCYFPENHS